jgi:hypothetical protein
MPSFDLLPDLSPAKSKLAGSPDEPFIYLLQLNQRAAAAGCPAHSAAIACQ